MRRKTFWLRLIPLGALLVTLPLLFIPAQRPHVAGGGGVSETSLPALQGELTFSWGIERIAAPDAWWCTIGSDDVVVAVIDSGIDTTVPQLEGNLWTNPGEISGNGIDDDGNGYIDDIHGWDFRDNDSSSLIGSKFHWHGTFVAGIIAARPGAGKATGVAPGIRIMDLRFLDSKNLFYSRDWKQFAKAVDYAVDNGAQIINLSVYANGNPPRVLEQALDRAAQRGVILVGIAGNDSQSKVCYPAKYSSVLAVSATDTDDRLASFSNHGAEVGVAAPGEQITSLFPGGAAGTSSGTSFSAPHVSGTLALILSANPGLSPSEAIDRLKESSVDLGERGPDSHFGAGLINAGQAVESAA